MANVGCVDGVEVRGNVYYLRWRVPAEFKCVESRLEVNRSLKTRDPIVARSRAALAKDALRKDWQAQLFQKTKGPSVDAFQASISVLRDWGISYMPMIDLLSGSTEELVRRINGIEDADPKSAVIPAALGALDTPAVLISEMPQLMLDRQPKKMKAKSADQRRAWVNKYKNAAAIFVKLLGDKCIHEISEEDAATYAKHWTDRLQSGQITTGHVIKRFRFLRKMIDEYHELAGILPSKRMNPMIGFKVKGEPIYNSTNEGGQEIIAGRLGRKARWGNNPLRDAYPGGGGHCDHLCRDRQQTK